MIRRLSWVDRGATAVEFALIVPILVMLLMGIVTFGFAYNDYVALTNAVREGARFGATTASDANWASDVTTRTADLDFGNLETGDVCVQLVAIDTAKSEDIIHESSCDPSVGSPPTTPGTSNPAPYCVVKVWAARPATLNIVLASWDITLRSRSAAIYERTPCNPTAP